MLLFKSSCYMEWQNSHNQLVMEALDLHAIVLACTGLVCIAANVMVLGLRHPLHLLWVRI
jgi:hypothetical protein